MVMKLDLDFSKQFKHLSIQTNVSNNRKNGKKRKRKLKNLNLFPLMTMTKNFKQSMKSQKIKIQADNLVKTHNENLVKTF